MQKITPTSSSSATFGPSPSSSPPKPTDMSTRTSTNQQPADLYPTLYPPSAKSSRYVTAPIKDTSKLVNFPTALKLRGSVIPNILVPLFIFSLWGAFVWALGTYILDSYTRIAFPSLALTIISLVLSLLLVFRTNTAYDRYWDGRKLWGSMITLLRNLSRNILTAVDEPSESAREDKHMILHVLLGVFIAEKNHLRNEPGLYDTEGKPRKDFFSLFPTNFFHTAAAFSEGAPRATSSSQPSGNPSLSHSAGPTTNAAALEVPKVTAEAASIDSDVSTSPFCARSNFTLYLCQYLNSYLIAKRKANQIDVPHFANAMAQLNNLTEIISQLDRIATTPIPAAYNIHLKQSLYIYLIFLPFQILQLQTATIVVVVIASFTLLGIAAIAAEIENPFGYDTNDLPLDQLQEEMRQEFESLMGIPYFAGKNFDWAQVWNHSPAKLPPPATVTHRKGYHKESDIILPQDV